MEKHLIQEIRRRFRRMPTSQRTLKIRRFMANSPMNEKLVKKAFPTLYREVTSSLEDFSDGGSSESVHPVELCAKPR